MTHKHTLVFDRQVSATTDLYFCQCGFELEIEHD